MSKRRKNSATGAMLELWRPPRQSGEPVGCLATTYTFDPGLFDEQCLARFLEIESEPNREDLAFLLEREARLGSVYAGVLVDHTQSGKEHSLRWDLLPVRIWGGKQHAKLSLLAWAGHVRLIVASANLTESGYRSNREIAMVLNLTPDSANTEHLRAATEFLRRLLAFVPAAGHDNPTIPRALGFLEQVERQVAGWTRVRPTKALRQHLVFTLPGRDDNPATEGPGFQSLSSLEDTVAQCRRHGGSPGEAWVASPFYDTDSGNDAATAALCKAMARGTGRSIAFCVPVLGALEDIPVRLAAPASLRTTASQYSAVASFEVLPQQEEGNLRPWHAKMLALRSANYSALLAGSSNFTRAGLGIGSWRNAEANVLTIAECLPHARLPGELEAVWPEMPRVEDPDAAQWHGPQSELDEEHRSESVPLPVGFLSAVYQAGDPRQITLRLDVAHLPSAWSVHSCGVDNGLLLTEEEWVVGERKDTIVLPWTSLQPPERLLVHWSDGQAYWALNVQDARQLPPPAELREMSADEMLRILAASDPGAALRAFEGKLRSDGTFDGELDAAMVIDLDPLRRHDLEATFLHRIRSRARVLAQLRQNLQRPIWSAASLQWRLEGFIGIRPLAERLVQEVITADGRVDETVLTLADFLIVLDQVEYAPSDGAMPLAQFTQIYRPFLRSLATDLDERIAQCRGRIGTELLAFWDRVVERCRT